MMYLIDKTIERISRFFRFFLSKDFILNHKFQNKNQVTNANFIINSLKTKDFIPTYIFDIGCGHGEWTKKLLKFYPNSNFFLFAILQALIIFLDMPLDEIAIKRSPLSP